MNAKAKDVAKAGSETTETTNGGSIATIERPSWATDSQRGSEDVGVNGIILPRIDILQALSPQIKKTDPAYIPGAEQGQMFNTLSRQVYGEEVKFVPVVFKREWIAWGDRKSGGGFNGSFATEEECQAKVMELQAADVKADVVETHVHFILIVNPDGTTEEAVFSWSRSKIKISRKLNSLVYMTGTDRLAGLYSLRAIEVNGQKGEYWSGDAKFLGYAPKNLFDQGLQTYNAVIGGKRTIDRSDEDGGDAKPTSAEL